MRQTEAPPESFHPISDTDMDLDVERDDATSLSSPHSARDTVSSNYFGTTGSHRQLEHAISDTDMDLDVERDDATSLSSPHSARDTVSSNYFGTTGSHRQLEPAISDTDMDPDLERDDTTSLSSPHSARDTVSSNCFGATGSHRQLEPAISEWPRQLHDTRDKPGLAETSDPFTKRKEDDLSPGLATFLTKKGFKFKLIL